MPVRKIVSGGQTGVDRGALDAAIGCGLEHGGFCPRGRRAEDGIIPEHYRLEELDTPDYPARTEANVVHSDGTLVLAPGEPSRGTALTVRLAKKHGRPLLVVNLDADEAVDEIARWLLRERVVTLNVAGPRESGAPGIGTRAQELMSAVLGEVRSTAE